MLILSENGREVSKKGSKIKMSTDLEMFVGRNVGSADNLRQWMRLGSADFGFWVNMVLKSKILIADVICEMFDVSRNLLGSLKTTRLWFNHDYQYIGLGTNVYVILTIR